MSSKLQSNIGHFGVGAQNAAFYFGDREHVMSRHKNPDNRKISKPVNEFVMSGREIHERYKQDEATAYQIRPVDRALGDCVRIFPAQILLL